MKRAFIKSLASAATLLALIVPLGYAAGRIRSFDVPFWADVLAGAGAIVLPMMGYRILCNTRLGRLYLYDFLGWDRRE